MISKHNLKNIIEFGTNVFLLFVWNFKVTKNVKLLILRIFFLTVFILSGFKATACRKLVQLLSRSNPEIYSFGSGGAANWQNFVSKNM
jgi:hypothetical protein